MTGLPRSEDRLPRQLPGHARARARLRPLLGQQPGSWGYRSRGPLCRRLAPRCPALPRRSLRARDTSCSTSRGRGRATRACLTPSGCPAFDATLTAFNRKVDAAIRSVDHRTLVWYEPNVLFDLREAPTNVGGLDDPHAGFSWHDYCLGSSCTTYGQVMANAAHHVAQTHEATMMTEFGATNDASVLQAVVRLADQNMVRGSSGPTAVAAIPRPPVPATSRRSSAIPRNPRVDRTW